MGSLRFGRAVCNSLLMVALAYVTAEAQDYGGADSAPSIDWRTSYRRAVDEANRDSKPVLVRVTASWCGPCQQMKQLTFADSRVVELIKAEFVPLSIDADEHPELVSGFHIDAFPTTLIVAADLTIVKRFKGFQSADTLYSTLLPVVKSQAEQNALNEASQVASAVDPANRVKFGFDGFCLVSLLEETRARKGSPEFSAEHRGQTICFQSEEHRQRFQADPDKYWPVADGQCLVSSREGSMPGPGDPRMAVTWRGRTWMFSDRERQKRFIQSPLYYVNEM